MLRILSASLLGAVLFSGSALAKTCKLEIEGNDAMQFNKKELIVGKDCKDVELTLKHVGKAPKQAMGHNWVLSEQKDKANIVAEAVKVGLAADYTPKTSAVLAATKMIGGGETTTVKFDVSKLKKGGDYAYFCTFPGHATLMTGKLVVQ